MKNQENVFKVQEEQAEYKRKPIPEYKRIQYLEKLEANIDRHYHQWFTLMMMIGEADTFGFDINDFMQEKYPFPESYDDMWYKAQDWLNHFHVLVQRQRKALELNLANRNTITDDMVEEGFTRYGEEETRLIKALEHESEERMKEINRLRGIIRAGRGFEATFVELVGTENTGGGVMVDYVTLHGKPFVIGISDDCLVLYKNYDHFCSDESGEIGHIYFPLLSDIAEEPKVNYTPLNGKNIVSCRVHYENITVRDDEGYVYYISENNLISILSEFEFHPEMKRTRVWLIPIFPPVMEAVEEPAPYYTKKEAKGKFVCAVKLTSRTDCVRYHLRGDAKDGWPVLYDSEEEARSDQFFDEQTDTVVPAEKFKENGISIVKEPQAEYSITSVCPKCRTIEAELFKLQREFSQYKRESVKWSWEDVYYRAEERGMHISEDEAQDILERMIYKHDADLGINWITIDCYLDMR